MCWLDTRGGPGWEARVGALGPGSGGRGCKVVRAPLQPEVRGLGSWLLPPVLCELDLGKAIPGQHLTLPTGDGASRSTVESTGSGARAPGAESWLPT